MENPVDVLELMAGMTDDEVLAEAESLLILMGQGILSIKDELDKRHLDCVIQKLEAFDRIVGMLVTLIGTRNPEILAAMVKVVDAASTSAPEGRHNGMGGYL